MSTNISHSQQAKKWEQITEELFEEIEEIEKNKRNSKNKEKFLEVFSSAVKKASLECGIDSENLPAFTLTRFFKSDTKNVFKILIAYANLMRERKDIEKCRWALDGLLSESSFYSSYLDDETIVEAFKLMLNIEDEKGEVDIHSLGERIIRNYKKCRNNGRTEGIMRKIFNRYATDKKNKTSKILRELIAEILKSHPNRGFSGKELAEEIIRRGYNLPQNESSRRAVISRAFKELQKRDPHFKTGKRSEGYYMYVP